MYKLKRVILAIVLCVGLTSAQELRPPFYYGDVPAFGPLVPKYDFQVIPRSEVPATAVSVNPLPVSIWDCIPGPITAIKTIGSTAVSLASFVLSKIGWIALGSGLVVGLCAFTSYCDLIVEAPFVKELNVISNSVPYLDNLENIVSNAYHKYNGLQFLNK